MKKTILLFVFCLFAQGIVAQLIEGRVTKEENEGAIAKNDSVTDQKDITICWDTSISMSERDIDRDFSVLADIFEKSPEVAVQLLLFDLNVEEKKYTVANGNWDALKQYLLQVNYDGAVDYGNLKDRIKYPKVYVFTGGNRVFEDDVLSSGKGSLIVNSCPNRNVDFLRQMVLYRGCRLMDFADILPENIGKAITVDSVDEEQEIEGTIYKDNKRAANLKVSVKGSSITSQTDAYGNFSIAASKGDSLLVYEANRKTVKIVPIEEAKGMKIFMGNYKPIQLDEVVVTEDKKEEKMLLTAHGPQKENSVGYGVVSIPEERIMPIHTKVGDILPGKVAGLNVKPKGEFGQQGLGTATIRGVHSLFVKYSTLIVIDGIPLQRSLDFFNNSDIKNYDFLDPNNIADITVLKSLAATNKYGNMGAGGAIVITTKTAKFATKDGGKKDLALVKDNIYTAEKANITQNTSPFLKALQSTGSQEEAYHTYLTLRAFNGDNIAFYLDAFDFFRKDNPELASRIISNVLVLHPKNISKARTVALSLKSIGYHENALKVNSEIIKLEPTNVQAHLDKALLKEAMGRPQEALEELLALMPKDDNPYLDISSISKTLEREIRNMIFKHKNKLDTSKVEPRLLNDLKFGARLVFEWNDPEAEFEIQFVSPQKRYFNWEHSSASNSRRIRDEIAQGFVLEEFELYDNDKGQWVINAKYLGDTLEPSEVPLVLRCKIIKNFGSASQSENDILLHFDTLNEKREVASLEM